MSNGVWFASESGGSGLWALSESTSSAPVITSLAALSGTELSVAWTGDADEFRKNGGAAEALTDTVSPATLSGLTANSPYTIELRYLGGAWSDPVSEWTDNTGSGGGDLASDAVPADGVATVSAVGASLVAATATSAAGVATTSATGAGLATASAVPAAGAATVSAVGDTLAPGETVAVPAAGLATVSAVGASIAAASAVPTAGSCTVSAVGESSGTSPTAEVILLASRITTAASLSSRVTTQVALLSHI